MTTIARPATRPGRPVLPAPQVAAVADNSPIIVGLIPFALAIGASAAANGLSFIQTMAGAWLLMAGAAQMAAVNLIGSNADAWLTIATIVMINLRFVIYGAGVARWFASSPLWLRMTLAIPLVDQNFLLSEQRFTDDHDQGWRVRYYLTVSASLIVAFVSGQIIGFVLGASVPASLGLHMAAPLAFVGMLAKAVVDPAGRRAAVAAGVAMLVVVGLPIAWMSSIALPIAIGAGVVAAGARATESAQSEINEPKEATR